MNLVVVLLKVIGILEVVIAYHTHVMARRVLRMLVQGLLITENTVAACAIPVFLALMLVYASLVLEDLARAVVHQLRHRPSTEPDRK